MRGERATVSGDWGTDCGMVLTHWSLGDVPDEGGEGHCQWGLGWLWLWDGINSLAPGRCGNNFKYVITGHISQIIMTSSNGNIFCVLCRNSQVKGHWHRALMFSLFCAGDLWCHRWFVVQSRSLSVWYKTKILATKIVTFGHRLPKLVANTSS